MKTTWLKTAIAVAVGALSTQAMAAGFALNEQSISGMGTSFAGRSSSADDASTVFGNPAGMSRLKREQVTFGVAAINAKTDIKDASGAPGSNDGDMVPAIGVPMGYWVKPLDEKVTFGLGVYAPFGLVTDYESGFQGRYEGDYSEVRVVTIQPTLSYRFNDQLSVGLGATINRIDGQLESAVPASPLGAGDSRVKIKGDDVAAGFNIGVLYEFSPSTRMGLTYHSKVEYELEGDTTISGNDPIYGTGIPALGVPGINAYGKYDASLDLTTPEMADLSITHELNDQWTLYAGASYTRWSRLESIVVQNEGVTPGPASANFGTISEEQDWHDTWSYALGAAYKLNKEWTLRTGVAMDQSPTNNVHRSPRIPTGDRTAVSFGVAWNPSDDVTVDLAYSYLWEEDAKIRQDSYNATYENSAHGFGAGLTYRF
ncbi:outer membrane protein transport protein [Pseudomonas stutzeri]|uniref:OmpP1/FadL family transporter n=1 Tax=Stutzerimonas stutzeri TaxID=316 RepID=UPI001F52B438|nr:outer membrane protein transport protein [Stutzerimonas stutzeri]MCI0919090.1 outer membrane protein transport protein [Stutzerimonas stutzeri]